MAKRECAPLSEIPGALAKTGFLLEHSVGEDFRNAGWTVIGNRYYVDDVDGKARELDLVAYQIKKGKEIDVCTGVLISCKKDSAHTWAFMSKDKPRSDPNFDWEPVHWWTDVEPLAAYLSDSNWRKKYFATNDAIRASVFNPTRDVFAFQLVSSDGKSPKNDTPIFDCVTGLLKALDHELSALPERQKGKRRLYIFTLVAVVDAPIVDVQYRNGIGTALEVDSLLHLARYMVKRREMLAHIHFVRSDKAVEFIGNLSGLAKHNVAHAATLMDESYRAIRTSAKVRRFLAKQLELRLGWRLNEVLRLSGYADSVGAIQLSFSADSLSLEVDLDEAVVEFLNANVNVREQTRKLLFEVARYEGDYAFTGDIPF